MRVEVTGYVEDVQKWYLSELTESFEESGFQAITRAFNADANTEEAQVELIAESERLPVVLVGIRDKVDGDSPSTDPRFKWETLQVDILICVSSRRSGEVAINEAWPLIEVAEEVMTGRDDFVFSSDSVKQRDAVRSGSVSRVLEVPGFIIQQISQEMDITRVLSAILD